MDDDDGEMDSVLLGSCLTVSEVDIDPDAGPVMPFFTATIDCLRAVPLVPFTLVILPRRSLEPLGGGRRLVSFASSASLRYR